MAVVVLAVATTASAQPNAQSGNETPQQQFERILRSYPAVGPQGSMKAAAELIEGGVDFPDRPRAEYWIGTARHASADSTGARVWLTRVRKEYPTSVWSARAAVTLGDLAAEEKEWTTALTFYDEGERFGSPVAGFARLSREHLIEVRGYDRLYAGCIAFAIAFVFYLLGRLTFAARAPWRLPIEARVLLIVIATLLLLGLRQQPEIVHAAFGIAIGTGIIAVLTALSFSRVPFSFLSRLVHAALAMTTIVCVFYAVTYRSGMLSMVLETLRAGPE